MGACLSGAIVAAASLLAGTSLAQTAPPPVTVPVATERRPAPVTGYVLSPKEREKAVAYARARYRLHFLGFGWELAALSLALASRLAPWLRDRAEASTRRRFLQALFFVPPLLLAVAVLELPVGLYAHHLSLAYGLSVQGWGSWLWDWAKGNLAGIAISVPLVWALYGLIRRSPRRWWLYAWLLSLPVLVILVFLSPYVLEPLFFRFEPLAPRHPRLARDIERVAAQGGLWIPRGRIFEMNASEKLASVNAYVTGVGPSKRVVVWDTTLVKLTVPQTLAVFGHEMGHDALRHVPKTIVFLWALLLAVSWAAFRLTRLALARRGARWGIRGLDDWASLPALLLALALLAELAAPAINGYSRRQEHEADVYGLEVTHGVVPDSSRAAAEAFQVLGEIDLADPDPSPFVRFWLYSHPPLAERLRFALEYDPWTGGKKPRYVGVNRKS